ncbi:FtsK/SpoIIIE domain-containing protein [Stackebrandtia soli]|uniref:FtsK/SpoIIIE domain-containing protein n=1 Tax=Stackebrandtia soli TaxID=1892856 RepID=UPI0039EC1371
MPGWRKRLSDRFSEELALARGSVRRLAASATVAAGAAASSASAALGDARAKQAALSASHRKVLNTITDKAEVDIAKAVDTLTLVCERLSDGPAAEHWSQWNPRPYPHRAQAGLFRVGRLLVGPERDDQPPALVPLLDHSHLRIAADAEPVLPGILLRALGSASLGAVRLSVYDPERLGGSLAGFAPLTRGELLGFVGPQGLNDLLDEHIEHIRRINATVLAGEYAGLRELAMATGRRPEPWRVLVLLGAQPEEWKDDQRAQLARIRRAGIACGVHLVVVGGDVADDTDTITITAERTSLSGQARVSLDAPPPQELVRQTCRRMALEATAGPPPARLADLIPQTLWTDSSAGGLRAPVGEGNDGRLAELVLGDNPPHALIGGPSGSGKTNLLYTWLGALTSRYHPDELELYLLDFKEGVSFARFASGRRDPSWLPHVRLIGVNVNDDREYGLAMLRHLRDELRRRAEAAKRHEATKLEELRDADPEGRWPRLVAVVDEFQVLLDGRDAVANEAVILLEDLARRGRSQGIHLVLASQDVAGIEALWGRPSLIAQFTLRVALPKARRLLADTNTAADEIPRFHAVLNPDSGVAGANRIVRLPDASDRKEWGPLQQRLWDERPPDNDPPILFDGDRVPVLPDTPLVPDGAPAIIVGQSIDVASRPATLRLTRAPGRNLAVLGTRLTEACDILAGAALSLARQLPLRATVCCLDPDAVSSAYRLNSELARMDAEVDWRDSLTDVVDGWQDVPDDRLHLVLLYAPDAASASLGTAGRDRLRTMLMSGPERRVHTVGWWRSVPRLRDDLGGFAARFDAIDAWLALDVQGTDLAPISPGAPLAWYPRARRALYFDRATHRTPEVVIPYNTEEALPSFDNLLTGSNLNGR